MTATEPRYTTSQREEMQQDLLKWICEGKTLRNWSRQQGKPRANTVYYWLKTDPVFAEEFRGATMIGSDMLAQQCLDIADSGDVDDVADRKLRIETRLRLLAKWDARYSDTRNVKVTGAVEHKIEQMTQAQVTDEIVQILANARGRQLKDAQVVEVEVGRPALTDEAARLLE